MPHQYDLKTYSKPENMQQAVELLSKSGNSARVIAGGTDILPRRQGTVKFGNIKNLIDISEVGLNYIKKSKNDIRIGAATDINTIATEVLFNSNPYQALIEAALAHSTHTIRNQATIGGNLCNASPCADLALPLLALSASLVIKGVKREYSVTADSFFKGPGCTILLPDEILKEIIIPLPGENSGTSFIKLRRHQTDVDMAIVNVATSLSLNGNNCMNAVIALGAVGPTPFLAGKSAAVLSGRDLNEKWIEKAAVTAAGETAPINDSRATADYRREMVSVLVRNSLEKSLQRSRR